MTHDPAGSADDAADRAEVSAERAEQAAVEAEEARDVVEDDVSRLGRLGAPFERRNPFYIGLVGGIGATIAWVLVMAIVGIGSVLLLVVVSLFLAAGLNPAVEFLERRHLSRGWACLVVILVSLGAIGLFLLAIVPVISDQVSSISTNAPHWIDELSRNRQVQKLDDEFHILDKVKDYVSGGDFVTSIFGGVVGFGLKVISALFNALIILVLTLYFLTSLDTTKNAVYSLAPASRRDRVSRLGDEIIRSIGGYVSGAFIIAVAAGLSTLIFLFIVGLGDYAVALAFVVALLDVIPMIGATLGAVIVSAIAFATDLHAGIACVIFYIVYQQFENYVVYPRVMRRTVNVPGAVTVIAALVGTALLGIVGALLAIPTASAILLILREVVVKRQDER